MDIRTAKEDGVMQVWLVGDTNGQLALRLARHLSVEVHAGVPNSEGEHIVIVSGQPASDEALASAFSIVLVEPELAEKDRVTRLLAGQGQPRLEILTNVGAGIRAERSWSLVLSMAARIPEATTALAAQSITHSDLVTGNPSGESWLDLERPVSLFGGTIGFVGFTPMGWRMAELAAQLGMKPVYWPEPESRAMQIESEGAALRSGATEVGFADLLAMSDVIVLDVCYSDSSVRLIDSPELALMLPGAMLVNTAHGRAIDEGALIQALRDGRLGGVALDRFNYEPLPDDSPLRGFERALLTPGIAVPTDAEILDRTTVEVARTLSSSDAGPLSLRRVRHIRRRRASP